MGPQLDGIGLRGAERLIEDILDPSRVVDTAFQTTLLILKDGSVVSGLLRREEGANWVLAESTGQETSIPKNQVQQSRPSTTSLMPDNFSELLSPDEFTHLLQFLISSPAAPAGR